MFRVGSAVALEVVVEYFRRGPGTSLLRGLQGVRVDHKISGQSYVHVSGLRRGRGQAFSNPPGRGWVLLK